jgi:hypothetical protein
VLLRGGSDITGRANTAPLSEDSLASPLSTVGDVAGESAISQYQREGASDDVNVLILGSARRYEWPALEPFVRSLQLVGFRGETVLFVNRIPPGVTERLERNGVMTRHYAEVSIPIGRGQELFLSSPHLRLLSRSRSRAFRTFPRLTEPFLTSPTLLRMAATGYTVILARFFLYLSYVLDIPPSARPSHIILTDVRDVIFQRDPSEFVRVVPHLAVGMEGPTIGQCAMNSEWVRSSYGPDVLESMSAAPVSCAGVTIGTYAAIRDYLTAMVEQLLVLPSAEFWGPDQAAHNYLLHQRLLPPCQRLQNGSSAVLTLSARSSVDLDESGMVLNTDGSVPTIVHQFDRHPELERLILSRLSESHLTFDAD